jgi:replication factor A1
MFLPIREISPYQRKWTIKARVTSKGANRTINTSTGRQTSVFSADLLDADGGEIKCSFWGDCANKYYPTIEEGKVYTFGSGTVKVANKRFNSLNHAYEVSYDRDDVVISAVEDDKEIETIKYNFASIRSISSRQPNASVDLCAVISKVGTYGTIKTKLGAEIPRRTLTLVDSSCHSIDITVWNEAASPNDEAKFQNNPVVAFKGCLVRDFGGRSLSLGGNGRMDFECQDDAATRMRKWWETDGKSADVTELTNGRGEKTAVPAKPATIMQMRAETTEYSAREPIFFKTCCYLASIRTKNREGQPQPIHYDACPECRRKITNGTMCHNCNKNVTPNPRALMLVSFVDRTDVVMTTVFDDQTKEFLEQPIERLISLSNQGADLQDELRSSYYKKYFNVTFKAQWTEYEGQGRQKFVAMNVQRVSAKEQCHNLFKQIQSMDSSIAVN